MGSNFQQEMTSIPVCAWILIIFLLLAQGVWIFKDAQKKGIFPWLWGIWGLLNFPTPLVLYYFVVIRRIKKRSHKSL
ncbi:MAG: hypothetical protein ACOWWR_12935 [Eubacteriales bacterium]